MVSCEYDVWHEFYGFMAIDCTCPLTAPIGKWGDLCCDISFNACDVTHTAAALRLGLTDNHCACMMQHAKV